MMNLEDITINHIKILKAVDDCQSFSNAAKQLGYSQALISKKVKQLEDYFGTRLLNRSPGPIRLTHKGRKLISQIYKVVDDIKSLQTEFQATFSSEGEEIVLGVTPLLSEIWLKDYVHRFHLCFPDRQLREEIVQSGEFFSESNLHLDLLLDSSSAYKEEHHCNRLQTYNMILVSFDAKNEISESNCISVNTINFEQVVLVQEIYKELAINQFVPNIGLDKAVILSSYQEMVKFAHENQKLTILPTFCKSTLEKKYKVSTVAIQDINEYGVYLHVPHFSELLVLAESLVRSFSLDQNSLEFSQEISSVLGIHSIKESNLVRIGIQRDSVGQLIAGYGVKYISNLLRESSLNIFGFKNLEGIDRSLDFQVNLFSSGELMNRQMKKAELDICILDDVSLLNNGSCFFDDLSFGSKLIGIASYNIFGQDISILIPKTSPITSLDELRGKRISTLFGFNSHRFIITLFNLYDMDVSKDCTLVNEDPRTASTSLRNGDIDAYVCCETFALVLEKRLFLRRLYQEQAFSVNLPSLRGIVCRSQFIKENPKSVVAYLHDLIITNYWFSSNLEEASTILSKLVGVSFSQVSRFFDPAFGTRIDPTLKPQWSWLLKTLNRRLEGKYNISKFDVDFWVDDYFLRLVYSLLDLDYHFHQVSFSSELSSSYFVDEKFSKYMKVL